MSTEDWIVVTEQDGTVYWRDGGREEIVSTIAAGQFVADCGRFLPADPRHQAKVDVPRMKVVVNRRWTPTIDALEARVHADHHTLCWILCTQIVFGTAYEAAMVGLPTDYIVCEDAPPRRANLRLTTDRHGRIKSFSAFKDMRTLDIVNGTGQKVSLAVLHHTEEPAVQVTAARW
jgi:hypothetical protein